MHEINFSIKTLSPIVISAASNATLMTESHDEISGSMIRGILAARYIKEKILGVTAHENETFRKLFFGELKFLSATLAVSGRRSFILPQSLQRGKKGTADEKKVLDLLSDEKTPAGYKSLRGYGIVDGEKIFTASVKKNIFMHMSRSEDEERISGKSEVGHIYNYEALEAGQIFCGQILGTEDVLKSLQLENKSFVECIGRSRSAQYGKCEFTFGVIKKVAYQDFGEKIFLRLESPLISANDNFISAEKILRTEVIDALEKICDKKVSLGKIFASGTEVENFVNVWGMKRPRVQALATGTIFEIISEQELSADDKKILYEKFYCGFGVRTEEGFGQARIWNTGNFTLDKFGEKEIAKPEKLSDLTKEIAKSILMERYLEQLRIYAHEDAAALTSQLQRGNFTHFFSRLLGILTHVDTTNIRSNFKDKLSDLSKDGTLFQDNLKKIYVGGQKLYDVLTGAAKLPYEEKSFFYDDSRKVFDDIGFDESKFADKFCLEYLQNFFRAARKIAALKGGDNND